MNTVCAALRFPCTISLETDSFFIGGSTSRRSDLSIILLLDIRLLDHFSVLSIRAIYTFYRVCSQNLKSDFTSTTKAGKDVSHMPIFHVSVAKEREHSLAVCL